MNLKDLRWRQRFENFEKSFLLIKEFYEKENMSRLEKAGMVQFFEMTIELAWKVLKDYLESEEMIVKTPRETIKSAWQVGLIDNADIWLEALGDRNLASHTYNEDQANKLISNLDDMYYAEFDKLYNFLKSKL